MVSFEEFPVGFIHLYYMKSVNLGGFNFFSSIVLRIVIHSWSVYPFIVALLITLITMFAIVDNRNSALYTPQWRCDGDKEASSFFVLKKVL